MVSGEVNLLNLKNHNEINFRNIKKLFKNV